MCIWEPFIFIPILNTNAQTEGLKNAQQSLIDSASSAQLTEHKDTTAANEDENAVRDILAKIIGYILAMLGVILLFQIVLAGYTWTRISEKFGASAYDEAPRSLDKIFEKNVKREWGLPYCRNGGQIFFPDGRLSTLPRRFFRLLSERPGLAGR